MKYYFRFTLALSLLLSITASPVLAQEVLVQPKKTPVPTTCDLWTCQLPKEIMVTERFLRDRKNGFPYTPEPRNLTPFVEVLRLNQLSQTMGYLNLYRSSRYALYRDEALNRVEYFLSLGPTALGNGPRDGMIAYMYLDAYDLFHDGRYLNAGLAIADTCAGLPDKDLVMNGGLMCALGLGAAYRATGSTIYRDASRRVTENTAPKQFPDGAFPHLPTLAGGKNIGYTTWMVTEMLLLSEFDPQDPNTDFLMLKSANLISQLIDAQGQLITQTATENYASDPGNENVGYGTDTAGLFSVALTMMATGRKDLASRSLKNGFSHRMGGVNNGGYPDVYNPTVWPIPNAWANGSPSVLRTSLIFWFMTMYQKFSPSCTNGPTTSCMTSATNCSAAMAAVGACTPPVSGTQTCIGGRYTACLDIPRTSMQFGQACGESTSCADFGNSACYQVCTLYGSKICYNGQCGDVCRDVNAYGQPVPTCTTTCYDNQSCLEPAPVTEELDLPSVTMCRQLSFSRT